MELNYQTEKKIKDLKERIKKKEKIKTDKKFYDWLEKYKDNFTEKQLNFLGYEPKIEILQEEIEIPKENKKETLEEPKQKFEVMDIKNLSIEQRQAFLLSDDFFELILKRFSDNLQNGKFEIPQKYLKMPDVKLISCRASEELYTNITKIARENGFSITSLLNYIFGEFIERYKR